MRLVPPPFQSDTALVWEVDQNNTKPGVFFEASPASDPDRVLNGTYYFSQLNLKMRLNREMFVDHRKILRVRYETAFIGDKMTRCDIGSYVGGNRISINNSLMC